LRPDFGEKKIQARSLGGANGGAKRLISIFEDSDSDDDGGLDPAPPTLFLQARLVASQSTLLRSNKDILYHVGSTALVPLSSWPIVVTFLAESHYITPWECDILVHNSIFWSRKIAYLRPILGHFGAQT